MMQRWDGGLLAFATEPMQPYNVASMRSMGMANLYTIFNVRKLGETYLPTSPRTGARAWFKVVVVLYAVAI
jgi:hypothetical protein